MAFLTSADLSLRSTLGKAFDPEKWKSDYPNPAFLSRLPDDEFWGAKQVMAFTDDDIRAIVEPHTQADPELKSSRRYTNLSAAEVRHALIDKGYSNEELPAERTLRDILNPKESTASGGETPKGSAVPGV